jgi:hypothetical protein
MGEFVSDFNQGQAGWIRYYDWLQGYAAGLSAGYAGRHGKAVNLEIPYGSPFWWVFVGSAACPVADSRNIAMQQMIILLT